MGLFKNSRTLTIMVTMVVFWTAYLTVGTGTLKAGTPCTLFGYSVSGDCDLNGDGIPDLIVGCYKCAPSVDMTNAGRVFIYSGEDTCLIRILDGEAAGDHFGMSVACAGDVNDDNVSDFIVGAPYADPGGRANAGKAYVYSGETFELIHVIEGPNAGDLAGRSVDGIGNINYDACQEIIVGHPGYNNGSGRAVVYSPCDGWSVYRSHVGTDPDPDDSLGLAVAGVGDIDYDGWPDYLISAPYWEGTIGTDRGKVYTISGNAGDDIFPLIEHEGATNGALYGYSISGGYINSDSHCDFIVGAPGYSSSKGLVKIYHGSTGTKFSKSPIYGNSSGDRFGFSVAADGNFCGDQNDDIIIGAPGVDSDRGKVYVYHHPGAGQDFAACAVISGESSYDEFGFSVASAGDVGGSGNWDDMLVGAKEAVTTGPPYQCGPGKVYVYAGPGGASLQELNPYYPDVSVFTPQADDEVCTNSSFEITWDPEFADCCPEVSIELSRNGGDDWSFITPETDNDGSYQWLVLLPGSDNCLIRICCVDEGWPCDTSDEFSIIAPTISITSPQSGDILLTAQQYMIEWEDTCVGGLYSDVVMWYSTNGGTDWVMIDTATNTGSYEWEVDCIETSQNCLVRLCSPDESICDTSDQFSIIKPCINVTSPQSGDSLLTGQQCVIEWEDPCAAELYSDILIWYSTNGGTDWIVIDTTANTGSYEWEVDCIETSYNCLLRLCAPGECACDTSEQFSIVKSCIDVISPQSGDSLMALQQYVIEWEDLCAAGLYSNVTMSYSTNGGTDWEDGGTIPNTGSYVWNVPCIETSHNCLVRLCAPGECACDTSDQFSIVKPCCLTITFPTGAWYFEGGTTCAITWEDACCSAMYDSIAWRFSISGSWSPWKYTLNDGHYDWTVPHTNTIDGRIEMSVPGWCLSDTVDFGIYGSQPGCPYVSIWDGDKFVRDNNILPQSQELGTDKDVVDHYLLQGRLLSDGDRYRIRIEEFENEHCWADRFELVVIDHEPDVRVAVTDEGELLTFRNLQAPKAVTSDCGLDYTPFVAAEDEMAAHLGAQETMIVNFGSIPNSSIGRLFVVTDPGDDDYSKYADSLGINDYNLKIASENAAEPNDVLGSLRPREKRTVMASYMTDLLPTDGEDFVIKIAFPVSHSIDFIGLDLSEHIPVDLQKLQLISAYHSKEGDVTQDLLNTDHNYAELIPGEHVDLFFDCVDGRNGMLRDFVLISTGHYRTAGEQETEQSQAQVINLSNYPNPFNPATTIEFTIPVSVHVKVEIFNILGQRVSTLVDEELPAGTHSVGWSGTNSNGEQVASGVYLYRLKAGEFVKTKKMILKK